VVGGGGEGAGKLPDHLHGEIIALIRMEMIRPAPNQPRTRFDAEQLRLLAESIKEIGQLEPIKLKAVDGDAKVKYEIIDGERRYRALTLLGQKEIRAIVRPIESETQQFSQAVAANFCREPHTSMETARALKRLIEGYQQRDVSYAEAVTRSAAVCGKSSNWVYHHLGLLKLADEVAEMVEDKKISHQIGIALTSFKPEIQVAIAKKLIAKEMSNKKMLEFIESKRTAKTLARGGEAVRPDKRVKRLVKKVAELSEWADHVASMKSTYFRETFLSDVVDLKALVMDLSDLVEDLTAVKENIRRLQKEKQLAA